MKIEYSSNNSGGNWWLSDDDWKKLEKGGWNVHWIADEEDDGLLSSVKKDGRWLGALAKRASKDFETVGDAIRDFERLTGQDASDEGCNCCGPPHTFYWGRAVSDYDGPDDTEYGYCSGSECLQHLYDKVPGSQREATEALND